MMDLVAKADVRRLFARLGFFSICRRDTECDVQRQGFRDLGYEAADLILGVAGNVLPLTRHVEIDVSGFIFDLCLTPKHLKIRVLQKDLGRSMISSWKVTR